MTELHFRMALRAFRRQRPFRRFVIELHSGTRLLVTHPETIHLRDGMAVYHPIGDKPRPFFFDHESVSLLAEPMDEADDQ